MRRNGAGRTFLGRLARDVRGNTIAIMAAALLPLAGLIGGGVDMSRLYLVKTRLQQACDAGALAGRKAMGPNSWTTGTGSTNAKAEAMFTGNFVQGDYGSGTLTKTFTESNGVVNGTATSSVPMTIMKAFGITNRSITVNCTAKMEIPNSDIMFVLDTTGSMMCAPGVPSCSSYPAPGTSKIEGIRSAVKCFYEALEKVNTTEVCGSDPTATTATTTAQIRIGFVPYSVNVNVGKILPNAYLANNWTYQSRTANMSNVWTYVLGTETAISGYGSWSAAPTGLNDASTYSGFSTISGGSVTVNGVTYSRYPGGNSAACALLNTTNGGAAYSDTGSVQTPDLQSTSNDPPTYPSTGSPPTSQVLTYNQDDDHVATAYKYYYDTTVSSNKCRLQKATRSYTLTHTNGTSSKSITWTQITKFDNWTYQQRTIDVSGFKAGGSTWTNTISVSDMSSTSLGSYTPSGSSTLTSYKTTAPGTITWDGCIEERQTFQNTDGVPSDDWATIPSSALDMNIDLVPSDLTAGSKWGPLLDEMVWGRYSAKVCSYFCTYTPTYDPYTSSSDLDHNNNYSCPTAAKKLTVYNTPAALESYVNGLTPAGATYHDIGMLWGARLISPTGIFASENATTSTGGAIQRHIIFMTDGDTNTSASDYSAYGIGYYDRRQANYAATDTQMDDMTNARLVALCTAIKNKNITLWVVSYGGNYNATTETRLSGCATPGRYYSATDTATLISRFRQIASEISELRLTS